MSGTGGFARKMLAALLRVALVAAMFAAGLAVYRRLPRDERSVVALREERRGSTVVRIVLRRTQVGLRVSAEKIPVQLYPVNMAAARNEFDSEHRPGQRFEEFVTRMMGDRQPLSAELDERGETVLAVPPGKWWVHASVSGARDYTWRLPVNVTGREKTVELTPDNAYARAKRF